MDLDWVRKKGNKILSVYRINNYSLDSRGTFLQHVGMSSIQLGIGDEGIAQQTVEWAKRMMATTAPDRQQQQQRHQQQQQQQQQQRQQRQEHQQKLQLIISAKKHIVYETEKDEFF